MIFCALSCLPLILFHFSRRPYEWGNEATDVKLELEEPKCQNFCIDNFMSMDMDKGSDLKFYGMDDFHSQAGRSLRCNNGGLHSFTSQQGEDELNVGALDGIFEEIDVAEGDVAAQSLAAACKDYLLDLDFTDEISSLNHHHLDKTQIGNSSSDSHSSECSGSSNGAVALSESLAGADLEPNGHDGICEETLSCGVSIDCRKQSPHAQHGEVNNRLLSSNIGKPNYLWNMTTTRINEPSYGRNSSPEARVDNSHLVPKRQRKPTKRYIEESTETKPSRSVYMQSRKSTAPLEGRRPRGRPPGRMGNGASGDVGIRLVGINSREEGDLNTSSLTFQQRERSQKPEICMEDEVEESSSDGSEDEVVKKKFKKGEDRRKHQRMWTLSETTRLVDGISQFGVGRWTQIKRLSFAASAHRTPIDLRDKWRNLLRASYAQTPTKGGIEEENNSGRLLPKSLLHHVRELASLHPYPRKDASRSLF